MALLNPHGLLDPGVHDQSLDEVAALFGQFQRSDRRPRLMRTLRTVAADVWSVDPRIEVLVDGSFVMGRVDEPEDVDVLLVCPPGWDRAAERRPFEYNALSRRVVQRQHGFDVFVAVAGEAQGVELRAFFQQVSPRWCRQLNMPTDTSKGLVKLRP